MLFGVPRYTMCDTGFGIFNKDEETFTATHASSIHHITRSFMNIMRCLPLQVGPMKGAGTHEYDAVRGRKMTECALEIDSAHGKLFS